jgi:FlaA1/EpsC-like NDP-sugar epimerase
VFFAVGGLAQFLFPQKYEFWANMLIAVLVILSSLVGFFVLVLREKIVRDFSENKFVVKIFSSRVLAFDCFCLLCLVRSLLSLTRSDIFIFFHSFSLAYLSQRETTTKTTKQNRTKQKQTQKKAKRIRNSISFHMTRGIQGRRRSD